ncbi:MAG: hypothetical protein HYS13_21935 [Planctomycetia bacterium]|nr:hypothetical protein [Planctomycetia bacterium]
MQPRLPSVASPRLLPGRWIAALLLALLPSAGCFWNQPARAKSSLLSAPTMSRDSVTLEIFFVRLPHEDLASYDAIWQEIDEQAARQATAECLAENGFRLGTIGGQLPTRVQQLLDLRAKPQPPPDAQLGLANVVNFDQEETVRIRQLQLRSGKRGEIVASGIHASVPLLLKENGQVHGQSYEKFQGELAVKSQPLGDGSVKLQLVPEVHYGDPRNRFTGADGVMRLEASRPRMVLDQMEIMAHLAPGEMLVLSSARDRPGSLGHYFFSDSATGRLERKLLFLRLSQTQQDDLFGPAASGE